MTDLKKLFLQVEALHQFFNDNMSENDAYIQMSADSRFGQVNRNVISSVYRDLRKKTIADYSANLDKFWHSSITVDCDETDQIDWARDPKIILNEHFAVVFHKSIEDEQFHHFTVLDLFNNVTRLVY
jgi:hypothetical protein